MTILNLLPPRDGKGLVIFGHFQKRISLNLKNNKKLIFCELIYFQLYFIH